VNLFFAVIVATLTARVNASQKPPISGGEAIDMPQLKNFSSAERVEALRLANKSIKTAAQ